MTVAAPGAGAPEGAGADLLVRRASAVFGHPSEGRELLAVVVRDGAVAGVVPERNLGAAMAQGLWPSGGAPAELDAAGRAVVPGFVDSHTHLAFAGDRADEFRARLDGSTYEAGGIMATVDATRACTVDDLADGVVHRAEACLDGGTTTIEVKSGYGLETAAERRLLEAVAQANQRCVPELVPTFLGAHLDLGDGYIDLVVEEMLPECAPLAVSCDVFCDKGAVSVDDARRVLAAGCAFGLLPRIHADELAHSGGSTLAAEQRCASADHLIHIDTADAAALATAGVVAVLLPATSFSLRSSYAPARLLLEAGATVALATDCNPGTSATMSMPFVIALACSAYGLSIDEAITAATAGGAAALRRGDIGHLGIGARADLVVVDGSHWVDIAYHPGMPVIAHVVKEGVVVR